VMLGDLMENLQLLSITSKIGTRDFTGELFYLKIFTWLKWGGICLLFALFFSYFSHGNLYSRVVGYAGMITSILGVLAFLHRSILNEIMAFSIGIMFLLLTIYCFLYRRLPTGRMGD